MGLGCSKGLEQFVDCLAQGLEEAAAARADGSGLERVEAFVNFHSEVQVGVRVCVVFESLGHVFLALVIHRVSIFLYPFINCQFHLSDAHASLERSQNLVGAGIIKAS